MLFIFECFDDQQTLSDAKNYRNHPYLFSHEILGLKRN